MRRPLFFLLAAVVPLLLYARTTRFEFVRADDFDLIAGNQPFLADLRNAPRAFARSYFEVQDDPVEQKTYYRPVAIVSFMLDAARGGADPRAYHLTNVVLHAAVTCLLLQLALTWGAPPMAALAAALIFAVHPVNVQAVAWIAGRNDLLLAMFGLISLICWTKSALGFGIWGLGFAAGHVAAFALALFSKETGLFFPALGVLHQRLALRAPLTRAQKFALAFDAVIVAVWAGLRAQALAGMPSEMTAATLRVAVMNAPQLLVHAGKLLVPLRLNVAPGVDWFEIALGIVAVAAGAWVAWKFIPRGLAIVAVAWTLVFLVPTLVVPGLPAYEHRAYVPLIGMLIALAAGRLKPAPTYVLLVAAALAGATYVRQAAFRNPFTYWTDASQDAQFGPLAHVNLGQLHEVEGRLEQARSEYLRALERDPNTPKAHNNLGVVLMNLGQPTVAVTHFEEEARRHPWNADAWFNLGLFEELRGNAALARRHYERAIAANRRFLPAYEKLGMPAPVSPEPREGGVQRP